MYLQSVSKYLYALMIVRIGRKKADGDPVVLACQTLFSICRKGSSMFLPGIYGSLIREKRDTDSIDTRKVFALTTCWTRCSCHDIADNRYSSPRSKVPTKGKVTKILRNKGKPSLQSRHFTVNFLLAFVGSRKKGHVHLVSSHNTSTETSRKTTRY